jgi:ATP/maltotriose-dependent transcriptional regulator MalT
MDSLLPDIGAQGIVSDYPNKPSAPKTAEELPPKTGELKPAAPVGQLSPREMEILRLVVDGLSNRQIADRLIISLGTVKAHVHNIFEKLHAQTRTQAVGRAKEYKLV